jgi:hypothetical protein
MTGVTVTNVGVIVGAIGYLVLLALLWKSIQSVGFGQVVAVVRRDGRTTYLHLGFNIVNPFAQAFRLNLRKLIPTNPGEEGIVVAGSDPATGVGIVRVSGQLGAFQSRTALATGARVRMRGTPSTARLVWVGPLISVPGAPPTSEPPTS